MGASQRLLELATQVHDIETREERLHSLLACAREDLDSLRRGAGELLEAIEDDRAAGVLPALSDRTAGALAGVSSLLQ